MTGQEAFALGGSLIVQAQRDVHLGSAAPLALTLTPAEAGELADLLDRLVVPADLPEMFRAATVDRFEPPPETDLRRYLDRLRTLQPDCLFAFAAMLAERAGGDRLRQWVDRVGPRYLDAGELAALGGRRRASSAAGLCLSLRIERDALSGDLFHAYAWISSAHRAPRPVDAAETPLRLPELRATTARLVAEHLPQVTPARNRGLVEVVLDPELLDLPVETWPIDGGPPIGVAYPVVVRTPQPIGSDRWDRVVAAEHYDPAVIAWQPGESAAALCRAITGPAAAAIGDAPVALWHRRPRGRGPLDDVLRGRGIATLPQTVRALREAAAAAPPGHPCGDLVLAWHDPGRAPWRRYRLHPPDRQRRHP